MSKSPKRLYFYLEVLYISDFPVTCLNSIIIEKKNKNKIRISHIKPMRWGGETK